MEQQEGEAVDVGLLVTKFEKHGPEVAENATSTAVLRSYITPETRSFWEARQSDRLMAIQANKYVEAVHFDRGQWFLNSIISKQLNPCHTYPDAWLNKWLIEFQLF